MNLNLSKTSFSSALLLACFVFGSPTKLLASEITINIEHQVLENRTLHTFFGAFDENTNLIQDIALEDIIVKYGDRYGDVRSLKKFESARFGTAYTFMIDISKSMSIQNFNLIKASIKNWVTNLELGDSVSLVTFGEEVIFLQDYTFNQDEFSSALDQVSRSDMETRFYDALIQTYAFTSQNNSDVPSRRVVICLTDGMDEILDGPNQDAVMESIKLNGSPTFMIGFAEKMTSEKIFGINLMKTISQASNGIFFDANRLGIDEAFELARDSIDNVFMLTSSCDQCFYDGSIINFDLNLSIENKKYTASSNLLMPQALVSPTATLNKSIQQKPPFGVSFSYLNLTFGILLLILIIYLSRVLRKKSQPSSPNIDLELDMMNSDPSLLDKSPDFNARSFSQYVLKKESSAKIDCQLIFLRSSTKHSISIGKDFLVGRSSKCNLVLKEHKEISGTHCRLSFGNKSLTVEDLNSTNGTFVNGARITKSYFLNNQDLLSLGKAEFRIIFKD